MRARKVTRIAVNGAPVGKGQDWLHLEYLKSHGPNKRNVHIALPRFVERIGHLSPRLLDLVELACYVYAADRYTSRGSKSAVEYQSWSRNFLIHMKVRDVEFWEQPKTQALLSGALVFLTGDAEYKFKFFPGHDTPQAHLWDVESDEPIPAPGGAPTIALFSGGLDSLAGAVKVLEESTGRLCLVSHQSRAATKVTQDRLIEALKRDFPGRVTYVPFDCTLTGVRAPEETQRSRSFLFCTIAVAVADALAASEIQIFENGVTSFNLLRREDLINARASRTTHPQAVRNLADLFSSVTGRMIRVRTPNLLRTKAEMIDRMAASTLGKLLPSSVSCSRVFDTEVNQTHCGQCFQCIERILSIYASGRQALDNAGLYTHDIIRDEFSNLESRTTAVDYLRQVFQISGMSLAKFELAFAAELADIVPFIDLPEREAVLKVYDVLQRHTTSIVRALRLLKSEFDDMGKPVKNSLFAVLNQREYLREPRERLADRIAEILQQALPAMFRGGAAPLNEIDLNKKMAAHLSTHEAKLRSEHPGAMFACSRVIPDHMHPDGVWVEAKYIRGATSPSVASSGIAEDITKFPGGIYPLFVVLDLDGAIKNDDEFRDDLEGKRACRVLILR